MGSTTVGAMIGLIGSTTMKQLISNTQFESQNFSTTTSELFNGFSTTTFAFQSIDTLETQPAPLPSYCDFPCPDGYSDVGEKNDQCYKLMNPTQTNTYSRALSYCQVDLIQLSDATIYNLRISQQATSSAQINDANAFCKAPKFCGLNNCSFEIFYDYEKDTELLLPGNSTSVTAKVKQNPFSAGTTINLPCLINSTKSFNISCSARGEWSHHPTMLACIQELAQEDDTDQETPFNQIAQPSCQSCYWEGTTSCSYNETIDGYICNCKPGWTKFTCWKAPDFCGNLSCIHGSCITVEEKASCNCEPGFMGVYCEINKSNYAFFGKNGSLPYANLPTLGTAILASTNILVLVLKYIMKVVILDECEDPQDTYQDIRHLLLSVGNLAAHFFTHPEMFGIDRVGCRFYFWFISSCYSLALLFWANESINVYTTVRTLNKNKWGEDFDGNKRFFYTFLPRVVLPFVTLSTMIVVICARGWGQVATTWTCFGTFSEDATAVWFPIMTINLLLVLTAFAFTEATCRISRFRPHCQIRLHNWFAVNKPFEDGVIRKLYAIYTKLMVMFFPKCLAPKWDSFEKRSRMEILARHKISRYQKEMDFGKAEIEKKEAKEREEIEKKNGENLSKFPHLPPFLLYNIPEEGPAQHRPKKYPVDITDKNYICEKKRLHWKRRWTRAYLQTRANYKESPEKCANKIFKREMTNGLLKQEKVIVDQAIFVWNEWYEMVPLQDHFVMTPHEDKLIIVGKEKDIDPLTAFDRAVSRLISFVNPWERQKTLRLLDDDEPKPFLKALDFLTFQPSSYIKSVKFPVYDNFGDVHFKEYLKVPDVLTLDQIEKMDEIYVKAMTELNAPFDKIYKDDSFLKTYENTEWKEAIKKIFKTSPKSARDKNDESEQQCHSLNPRLKPLDAFWLDERRPE
ncbi:unnamed protein product, partial [Mesorhabditis belari]|uniref:EGF-like domain-containing protein n=1 Tax=Mesorhabditis belari TaxID=2138241 RepID=A0AAF3EPR3_9BILA